MENSWEGVELRLEVKGIMLETETTLVLMLGQGVKGVREDRGGYWEADWAELLTLS
jgi:hypothetical protein